MANTLEVELVVGSSHPFEDVKEGLVDQGISIGTGIKVFLDRPRGWILESKDPVSGIIASDNLCPSYRLELLNLNPAALTFERDFDVLASVVRLVHLGQTITPSVKSVLTSSECTYLRLLAIGLSNKQIAVRRGVEIRTVKNAIYRVYTKLGLHTRVQAAYYYFGYWHLLSDWEIPEQVSQTFAGT